MGRRRKTESVALVCPADRAIELRYWCPIEKRKVRRSTGTFDTREAQRQAKLLEAQLLTGAYVKPSEITWQMFRDRYDQEELAVHHRKHGRRAANGALDAFEKLMRPALLAEAVTADCLIRFRNGYAAGKKSRFGSRSPHTVASRMATIIAAFHWAESMGMVATVPRIPKFRPGTKKKAMHGRPISTEEFERMLDKVAGVVGAGAADSWSLLLHGLVESGLRLDEAMHTSWDRAGTVRPLWRRGALPTLLIPGDTQKNADDDEIPLLPGFEALLLRTPEPLRTGWVFEPESLQPKVGRKPKRHHRLSTDYVSKVIVKIGAAAGIIVEPAKGSRPAKHASAHDLRRTCADRMEAAGVDPLIIARVMRHKSYETTRRYYAAGNVQRDAGVLREKMVAKYDNRTQKRTQTASASP